MNSLIIYVLHFTMFTHTQGMHEIVNPKPTVSVFSKESTCNETGKKILKEVFLLNANASNDLKTANFYCVKQDVMQIVPIHL